MRDHDSWVAEAPARAEERAAFAAAAPARAEQRAAAQAQKRAAELEDEQAQMEKAAAAVAQEQAAEQANAERAAVAAAKKQAAKQAADQAMAQKGAAAASAQKQSVERVATQATAEKAAAKAAAVAKKRAAEQAAKQAAVGKAAAATAQKQAVEQAAAKAAAAAWKKRAAEQAAERASAEKAAVATAQKQVLERAAAKAAVAAGKKRAAEQAAEQATAEKATAAAPIQQASEQAAAEHRRAAGAQEMRERAKTAVVARERAAAAAAARAQQSLLAEEAAAEALASAKQAKTRKKQESKRAPPLGKVTARGQQVEERAPVPAVRPLALRSTPVLPWEKQESTPISPLRKVVAHGQGAEDGAHAPAVPPPALRPTPGVSVAAEEVLHALEVAGADGEVGEGGFGKVYAAELPSLAMIGWGRRVAVKIANGTQAADILVEVRTLGMCSHRNVLPLHGYCDDARALCMITPLMHGGSLDDRLLLSDGARERLRRLDFNGKARLNWQQRLSALCDAARGLAHLHSERILHRDVKTANILLEGALWPLPMQRGPPQLVHRALLSDFGLAKVRGPSLGGGTTHATTQNLAFSTGFVDPALVNSNQHSEKTDAFGIGICVLMSLVSEPAAGLMKSQEDNVCAAAENGVGELFITAHEAAGWLADATCALAKIVKGLSIERTGARTPLPEALEQMEALLGAEQEVQPKEVQPKVVSKFEQIREALGLDPSPVPVLLVQANECLGIEPHGGYLQQADAILRALHGNTEGESPTPAPAPSSLPRPLGAWSRGVAMPPVREEGPPVAGARGSGASSSARREPGPSGGGLTQVVQRIGRVQRVGVGDAGAELVRIRDRVIKAWDSMMSRLDVAYEKDGNAPLPVDTQEQDKINHMVPKQLGPLNEYAHKLRR